MALVDFRALPVDGLGLEHATIEAVKRGCVPKQMAGVALHMKGLYGLLNQLMNNLPAGKKFQELAAVLAACCKRGSEFNVAFASALHCIGRLPGKIRDTLAAMEDALVSHPTSERWPEDNLSSALDMKRLEEIAQYLVPVNFKDELTCLSELADFMQVGAWLKELLHRTKELDGSLDRARAALRDRRAAIAEAEGRLVAYRMEAVSVRAIKDDPNKFSDLDNAMHSARREIDENQGIMKMGAEHWVEHNKEWNWLGQRSDRHCSSWARHDRAKAAKEAAESRIWQITQQKEARIRSWNRQEEAAEGGIAEVSEELEGLRAEAESASAAMAAEDRKTQELQEEFAGFRADYGSNEELLKQACQRVADFHAALAIGDVQRATCSRTMEAFAASLMSPLKRVAKCKALLEQVAQMRRIKTRFTAGAADKDDEDAHVVQWLAACTSTWTGSGPPAQASGSTPGTTGPAPQGRVSDNSEVLWVD